MKFRKKILTAITSLALTTSLGCTPSLKNIIKKSGTIEKSTNYSNLESKLTAGAAKIDITPSEKVPLAGYSIRLENPLALLIKLRLPRIKKSKGIQDRIYARAVILNNNHKKVGIVNTDLLLINNELKKAVEEQVENLHLDDLLICATHTHSSMGGYLKNWAWEFGTGKYEKKIFNKLVNDISKVIKEADKNLQPAKIGSGFGTIKGLSENRRIKNGPTDPQVGVIRIDDENGNPKTYIINFAAHATTLPPKDYLISGDYPGAVEKYIEKKIGNSIAIFTSGAAADQRVKCEECKYDKKDKFGKVKKMGEFLGEKVLEIAANIKTKETAKINSATQKIKLPPKDTTPIPVIGRLLKKYVPSHTKIQIIKINDSILMSVPGELGVELGLDLKKEARKRGYKPFVTTLANDHIGYIITGEAYKRKGYEYRLSLYGPNLGDHLKNRILKLEQNLKLEN